MLIAALALFFALSGNTLASGGSRPRPIVNIQIKDVVSQAIEMPSGEVGYITAHCPENFKALGGGFDIKGSATITPVASFPTRDLQWWEAGAVNAPLGTPGTLQAVAVCAHVIRG
jgi:hypothetical protein